MAQKVGRPKKHGMTGSRLYNIWQGIRQRCNNPNDREYKWYGARGIELDNDWLEFKPFYNWAINNGYKDNLTIDRIDVNGNYEPLNCRWVTQKEQNRNTRKNNFVLFMGRTKCLSEWAEILKSSYRHLRNKQINGDLKTFMLKRINELEIRISTL